MRPDEKLPPKHLALMQARGLDPAALAPFYSPLMRLGLYDPAAAVDKAARLHDIGQVLQGGAPSQPKTMTAQQAFDYVVPGVVRQITNEIHRELQTKITENKQAMAVISASFEERLAGPRAQIKQLLPEYKELSADAQFLRDFDKKYKPPVATRILLALASDLPAGAADRVKYAVLRKPLEAAGYTGMLPKRALDAALYKTEDEIKKLNAEYGRADIERWTALSEARQAEIHLGSLHRTADYLIRHGDVENLQRALPDSFPDIKGMIDARAKTTVQDAFAKGHFVTPDGGAPQGLDQAKAAYRAQPVKVRSRAIHFMTERS